MWKSDSSRVGEDIKKPLVSVAIPTHDRGQLIERAVRSSLGQTFTGLEVVVVDDGSTDDTQERIAQLAEVDPRVHHLRERRNQGTQAARKTGILVASGAHVAFLDTADEKKHR